MNVGDTINLVRWGLSFSYMFSFVNRIRIERWTWRKIQKIKENIRYRPVVVPLIRYPPMSWATSIHTNKQPYAKIHLYTIDLCWTYLKHTATVHEMRVRFSDKVFHMCKKKTKNIVCGYRRSTKQLVGKSQNTHTPSLVYVSSSLFLSFIHNTNTSIHFNIK